MNIVCTTVENYKLTLGNIYEVHDESRDFYTIINDNGIGVRYSKRLFRLEEEVVVPPPPPARTEADVIASIIYDNQRVSFVDITGDRKYVSNRFDRSNSNISCGVNQISGINRQIQEIDNLFDLGEDDYIESRKAVFKRCIEEYVLHNRNAGNQAMALLSTNVTGTDDHNKADEDMLMVLDELAHRTSDEMLNPNSRRNIKVWIMTYNRQ